MVLADFPLHRGGNHRSRLSTASRYPVPVPLEISAPERRIHGIHGTSSPSNVRNQRRPHFWPRTLEHFTSSSWDWMRTPAELLRAWQKEDQWGLEEGDFFFVQIEASQVPEASSNSQIWPTRQRAEPTNFQNLPKPHCLMVETPTVDRTFARYWMLYQFLLTKIWCTPQTMASTALSSAMRSTFSIAASWADGTSRKGRWWVPFLMVS